MGARPRWDVLRPSPHRSPRAQDSRTPGRGGGRGTGGAGPTCRLPSSLAAAGPRCGSMAGGRALGPSTRRLRGSPAGSSRYLNLSDSTFTGLGAGRRRSCPVAFSTSCPNRPLVIRPSTKSPVFTKVSTRTRSIRLRNGGEDPPLFEGLVTYVTWMETSVLDFRLRQFPSPTTPLTKTVLLLHKRKRESYRQTFSQTVKNEDKNNLLSYVCYRTS